MTPRHIPLYIDGTTKDGSGKSFASVNPATSKLIANITGASLTDVDRAVASSADAFVEWSQRSGTERGRILHKTSKLLRERRDELAHTEVLDTGKPIAEALAVDIDSAADALEFFAGVAPTITGETFDLGGPFAYTRREALGVCVGIGAWNYPLQIAAWKSAPALACGNTMVFKPAELTPMTANALAETFSDAGLPPGVFNVVHGDGSVGAALVEHPDVAKVSLTGEVGTGKAVMAAAAATLKAVTLELGGKSPLIICDDAELDNAVGAALMANFYTQGEVCSNGTRVFVHESIHDEFLSRLAKRTEAMTIGDPLDPNTDVGALISAEHLDGVMAMVESATAGGARLVTGGSRAVVEGCDGAFMEPTVLSEATDSMDFVRNEIFGPVMAVLSFENEDEVLARANDTPYGLAAGVFTQNLSRAHRMAAALDAGIVWVNNYNITPVEVPFGGIKQSGIGRENSAAAVEHYTQRKTVYVELGDVEAPY